MRDAHLEFSGASGEHHATEGFEEHLNAYLDVPSYSRRLVDFLGS